MWGGSRHARDGVTSKDAGQESRLTNKQDSGVNPMTIRISYSVYYCDLSTYQLAALQ